MTARDWDAVTYDRVSDIQLGWGVEVLDRLALRGDEAVLDAGCGTGRVTRLLLDRLPRGRVIAVDGSAAMVAKARETLPPEVDVLQQDLLRLELDDPVDVVFSNAVFHWIPDQRRLFERLHAALHPGGLLHAQCGGEGNLAHFLAITREVCAEQPFAPYLGSFSKTWLFSAPEAAARSLAAAGFVEIRCDLERKDVVPDDPPRYLASICLGAHLEQLPDGLRSRFVDAVVARAGDPLGLDYVRLNISARRP